MAARFVKYVNLYLRKHPKDGAKHSGSGFENSQHFYRGQLTIYLFTRESLHGDSPHGSVQINIISSGRLQIHRTSSG